MDIGRSTTAYICVNFYKVAGLPPLFKLLGFPACKPPLFVTCSAYYEAVFLFHSVTDNQMTTNDIRAYQTTSFIRIEQQKMQGVSRIIVFEFLALAVDK